MSFFEREDDIAHDGGIGGTGVDLGEAGPFDEARHIVAAHTTTREDDEMIAGMRSHGAQHGRPLQGGWRMTGGEHEPDVGVDQFAQRRDGVGRAIEGAVEGHPQGTRGIDQLPELLTVNAVIRLQWPQDHPLHTERPGRFDVTQHHRQVFAVVHETVRVGRIIT